MIRLTREQAREIDRRALEEFGLPGIVLMENAARSAVEIILRNKPRSALILCGGGNNGGDGLAIARHLQNHGVRVTIGLTIDPAKYRGDALINWNCIKVMNLPILDAMKALDDSYDLTIDAIFGTGLDQPPRAGFDKIVAKIRGPILAIDLPSGLDCNTGAPLGDACVKANQTITFAAEKAGFANAKSRAYTGEIFVGEIGIPVELKARVFGSSPSPV